MTNCWDNPDLRVHGGMGEVVSGLAVTRFSVDPNQWTAFYAA